MGQRISFNKRVNSNLDLGIEIQKGTRELIKAIIHPCYPDWKIQWKCKSANIRERKIKYFDDEEIRSGKFLVIKKLPELPIN